MRRLSITNHGDRVREIEVTSYAEIVLGRPEDDLAHPAFGKLFVETERAEQNAGLLFSRRTRSADEESILAFHVLGVEGRLGGAVEWETDRAQFLGRGRSPANPIALDGRALSGTTGAVLDPIAALRDRVRLAPGAIRAHHVRDRRRRRIATRRSALVQQVSRRQRRPRSAFSMAFTHAQVTLRHLGLTDDHAMLASRMASRVFGADASGVSPAALAQNRFGQPNLWGYGISGDLPIVLVSVTEADAVPLVRQVLLAQEYWRVKDLRADVVILNEHPADYLDDVQRQLAGLVQEPRWSGWKDKNGGVFLLRSDGMSDRRSHLLYAVARLVIRGRSRRARAPARSALAMAVRGGARAGAAVPAPGSQPPVPPAVPRLVMENGFGGFTPDGQRICRRPRGRPRNAAAVVERARQSAVRDGGQRVGRGVHVVGQQPREPPDALRQRSDHRPDRRSDLPARRRPRARSGVPHPARWRVTATPGAG